MAKKLHTRNLRSEKTISRILEVATFLISRKGYHGTSVEDITRAANLTKGAIYCHFNSKIAILHALIEKFEKEFVEGLIQYVNTDSGNAWSKLNRVLNFSADFAEKNLELNLFFVVVSGEMGSGDNELQEVFQGLFQKYSQFLRALVEEGQAQGIFAPDLDAQ